MSYQPRSEGRLLHAIKICLLAHAEAAIIRGGKGRVFGSNQCECDFESTWHGAVGVGARPWC